MTIAPNRQTPIVSMSPLQRRALRLRATMMLPLALLVGLGRIAAAEPDPAQVLSARGIEHFRHGEYARAIDAFAASYARWPVAELLYDIAQAYRLLGDCDLALRYYRRFVSETTDAQLREKANARIASMSSCRALEPAAPEPANPPPAAVAPATAPAPTPPSAPRLLPAPAATAAPPTLRRGYLISGIVAAGAALVLGGVAAYFSVETSARSTEVTHLIDQGGSWTPSSQAVEAAGQRDERASGVLWGAAAAGAIVGTTLLLVGRYARRGDGSALVAHQGRGVLYQGRF
jgi:tetratricopeptide (TPR) repeat protein